MICRSLGKGCRWGRLQEVSECWGGGGAVLYCWNLMYFMEGEYLLGEEAAVSARGQIFAR